MKLFLSIYLLGSFISLFMTIIILKIKKNKIEEAIEESEEMMPDDFKLKNAKEIMTQDMILLSNFTLSWIIVVIFLYAYIEKFFYSLIKNFKK
jgi:hypothetical protein